MRTVKDMMTINKKLKGVYLQIGNGKLYTATVSAIVQYVHIVGGAAPNFVATVASQRSYSNTYLMATVSSVVEDVHIVCGVVFNCVLLYAIRRFSRKSLGAYKHLLTIFAAYDVLLTVLHGAMKPRVVMSGTIFGTVSIFDSKVIMSMYAGCFTVPFVLMNIHFIYRYWSIRRPEKIQLFRNKKFIAFLSIFPVAEFVIWYLLCMYCTTGEGRDAGKEILNPIYERRFGVAHKEGWIIMNHWENDEFQPLTTLTVLLFDVVMIASFSTAATLAVLTFYYIRKAGSFSQQMDNLQHKLFIAVCAQTFVPLVFVYVPWSCALNFPFFRLPVFVIDEACLLLTSCFPAWDAVIMILLMKDYRNGLLGVVKKKPVPQPTTVWKTSSVNLSSVNTASTLF